MKKVLKNRQMKVYKRAHQFTSLKKFTSQVGTGDTNSGWLFLVMSVVQNILYPI